MTEYNQQRKKRQTSLSTDSTLARSQWKHRLYLQAGSAVRPLIPQTVILYRHGAVFLHVNRLGFTDLEASDSAKYGGENAAARFHLLLTVAFNLDTDSTTPEGHLSLSIQPGLAPGPTMDTKVEDAYIQEHHTGSSPNLQILPWVQPATGLKHSTQSMAG